MTIIHVPSITRSNSFLEGGHSKISQADFVGVMHEVTVYAPVQPFNIVIIYYIYVQRFS